MTSSFEKLLDKYAEVTVKVALNVQPGQKLLIGKPFLGNLGVPIELAPFVRLIVAHAYRAGARHVEVLWNDDPLRLIRLQHAARDSFDEFPTWRTDAVNDIAEAGDACLVIYAEDPDFLEGQDSELVKQIQQTALGHNKRFAELQGRNALNWAAISAPVGGWVDKVLPDVPAENRNDVLWDLIFKMCRIDQQDPVVAWQEHIQDLVMRRDFLNQNQYAALKLIAPGTDLTIGLPENHLWGAAQMTAQNGIDYTANIPTEEVFTLPHMAQTEGTVSSTKPLNYGGNLMDEFQLTFSEGRVVDVKCEVGNESLINILDTDEGARRIGEVALVPHSSPISQMDRLFYNTLIDENASCHIALGRGYKFNLQGGESMSNEDFETAGGNNSLVHVDFMIGSGEMDVDGLLSGGQSEPIMRAGEWAFQA